MKLYYGDGYLTLVMEDGRDDFYRTKGLGLIKDGDKAVARLHLTPLHSYGDTEIHICKKTDFEKSEESKCMTEDEEAKHREVSDYLFQALFAKEACHKQWAIERSLEILGMKLEETREELTKRSFMGNKSWEPGVQPP